MRAPAEAGGVVEGSGLENRRRGALPGFRSSLSAKPDGAVSSGLSEGIKT